MTRSPSLVLPLAVAAAIATAACAAPQPTEPTSAGGPQIATVTELTAGEQAFVDEVAAIAPPLADNPERLARRGASSCTDLTREDDDQVLANAVERFSGGSYTVTEDEARAILDAARTTVCAG